MIWNTFIFFSDFIEHLLDFTEMQNIQTIFNETQNDDMTDDKQGKRDYQLIDKYKQNKI